MLGYYKKIIKKHHTINQENQVIGNLMFDIFLIYHQHNSTHDQENDFFFFSRIWALII